MGYPLPRAKTEPHGQDCYLQSNHGSNDKRILERKRQFASGRYTKHRLGSHRLGVQTVNQSQTATCDQTCGGTLRLRKNDGNLALPGPLQMPTMPQTIQRSSAYPSLPSTLRSCAMDYSGNQAQKLDGEESHNARIDNGDHPKSSLLATPARASQSTPLHNQTLWPSASSY